jgi:hypothetical protein
MTSSATNEMFHSTENDGLDSREVFGDWKNTRIQNFVRVGNAELCWQTWRESGNLNNF